MYSAASTSHLIHEMRGVQYMHEASYHHDEIKRVLQRAIFKGRTVGRAHLLLAHYLDEIVSAVLTDVHAVDPERNVQLRISAIVSDSKARRKLTKSLRSVIQNYGQALKVCRLNGLLITQYLTMSKDGPRYLFEALPRILTLWFQYAPDLCESSLKHGVDSNFARYMNEWAKVSDDDMLVRSREATGMKVLALLGAAVELLVRGSAADAVAARSVRQDCVRVHRRYRETRLRRIPPPGRLERRDSVVVHRQTSGEDWNAHQRHQVSRVT